MRKLHRFPLGTLGAFPASALLLIAIAGCHRPAGHASAVPDTIIPRAQSDPASVSSATGADDRHTDTGGAQPRIGLDQDDAVLQIVNASLDGNPGEEQVIAVKRKSDVDSPVRLIVVDTDPARGTYFYPSWESPTSATNLRVFSLSLKDLVGDHAIELVASGMNKEGKLTLDVFRRILSSRGKALTYKPICQLVADEIRIEEADRPEGDSTGEKAGTSFPIVAYLRDRESSNVMDLIKISYSWKSKEGRYVPAAPEKIPGEKVEQKQLEKLFTSSTADAFEEFLAGSWVQIQPDSGAGGKDRYLSIINFDPRARKISISSGDTEEVYIWKDSLRTIYNRLFAIGENETVRQISKTFSLSVETVNTLTLSVQGTDPGETPSRKYNRITDEIQEKLLARADTQVSMSPVVLEGVFIGAGGQVVVFKTPSLIWTSSGQERPGIFALFTVGGKDILQARFLGPNAAPAENLAWLVGYRERRDRVRVVRTLTLLPVVLTAQGYEEGVGETLVFEQLRELKKK